MEKIAEVLGVPKEKLEELEKAMVAKGFGPALERVERENEELIRKTLEEFGLNENVSAEEIRSALTKKAEEGDNELYGFLGIDRENIDFHKVAKAAREIATESEGFFLKKEYGEQILREREPEALLDYLGYKNVGELLAKEDITEIFSALRFTETDAWMHKTFDEAYSKFTPKDFEHRPIEIKVLGPQWAEIGKKYVAKKHHNVSHLKEFGVIFLNPIAQSGTGKFVRDFALLLHYFHEIAFYSKLFERDATLPFDSAQGKSNFNEKFLSLLRGDVPEIDDSLRLTSFAPFKGLRAHQGLEWQGKWLIIQRYLWKENPEDPRLFLPHVNPEAIHWRKAEEDLVQFGKKHAEINLEFWNKLWSVAGFFGQELVSFDLEDNAMMVAHKAEGKVVSLSYHQHEALWNRIFAGYVGGYDELKKHVIENMEHGIIKLD